MIYMMDYMNDSDVPSFHEVADFLASLEMGIEINF